MAGYEIYPDFPERKPEDHHPAPNPADDPMPSTGVGLPEDASPFTLLYKLIDGKMEMILVRQALVSDRQEIN